MTDRPKLIAELGADPWYQLSTAGQELFHTNMLYWLAVYRPEESRPLWDLLGWSTGVQQHGAHAWQLQL